MGTTTGTDDDIYSLIWSQVDEVEDPFQVDHDLALAVALQEKLNKEDEAHREHQQEEEHQETLHSATTTGKALALTQRIIAFHEAMIERSGQDERSQQLFNLFSIVNADDVLCFTENMLRRQEAFALAGHDTRVDIGYRRCTQSDESSRIRLESLKTIGGFLGDGIYTANNPFVANVDSEGSDKVMMVARLKGAVMAVVHGDVPSDGIHFDTALGKPGAFDEICVLGRSSQCIPLVKFDLAVIDSNDDGSQGNDMVHRYHCRLQNMLDDCFNAGIPKTIVTKILPSQVNHRQSTTAPPIQRQIFAAPKAFRPTLKCIVFYTAPEVVNEANFIPSESDLEQQLSVKPSAGAICQLCGLSLQGHDGVVCRIPSCLHEFHIKCLFKRLKSKPNKCPTCLVDIGSVRKSLMLVAANSKPAALAIDANVDLESQQPLNDREVRHRHCNSSMSYVSIVPSTDGDGDLNSPKVSLAYACGSTFEVSLDHRQHDEAMSQTWSSLFHDPVFLQGLQKRVAEHSKKCTSCGRETEAPDEKIILGVMPTGTMRVDELPKLTCSGNDPGAFLITYRIESGIQKNYHESPGLPHTAMYREAYVPNNNEGRDLTKRLIAAFSRGMTFKVGTSISTGRPNSVTWSSISHKSSLSYGPFGYPDPGYFIVANEELDALGIPATDKL
jgi:Deltex C-terminal domain